MVDAPLITAVVVDSDVGMLLPVRYDTLGQAVTSFLSSWAKFLSHRLTHSDAVLCIKMAVINFFSVHNASGGFMRCLLTAGCGCHVLNVFMQVMATVRVGST